MNLTAIMGEKLQSHEALQMIQWRNFESKMLTVHIETHFFTFIVKYAYTNIYVV